jgi:hypothetical protein
MFTTLPCQVCELWLDPIVERYGWPFQSVDETTHGTEWRWVLPRMNLRQLAEFEWKREDVDFATKPLCQESLRTIRGLYQQHVLGLDTLFTSVAATQERFRACAEFILEHHTLPQPVILRDLGDSFELLDGNHRITAMLSVGLNVAFHVPAWIAIPSNKDTEAAPHNCV